MSKADDPVMDRLLVEAYARGWSDTVLATAMNTTSQNVTNWKARRLPPEMWIVAADALGWTVDRLLGRGGCDDGNLPGAQAMRIARAYDKASPDVRAFLDAAFRVEKT